MDRLCIVGGLVPSLLIDRNLASGSALDPGHAGTSDLDVGLAVALLHDRHYTEISRRLRQEDFKPDRNERGRPTPQRWRLAELDVTVDFLLPPIPGATRGGRVQHLEGDFGALIAPGLELAFDERRETTLSGRTLAGEKASRTVPVCGPAAFTVLKALAFADRGERKDAYDLVYTLRRWPEGIPDIADRLVAHTDRHERVVLDALGSLATDFADPECTGPQRAAVFEAMADDDRDALAADAHGYVDDLLRACRERELEPR